MPHRDQAVVLVFEIDQHRYGVDTEAVHEIVRAVMPTRLPEAPRVVSGLLNVRGEVVPLIDLRVRFGLPARAVQANEVFVIVRARGRRCALRADAASELVRVPRASIRAIQDDVPHATYITGTALLADGLLVICELDAFLQDAELRTLDAALAEAAP